MLRFLPGLACALLLTTGCGYVGDPRPPLANVPGHITDLAAIQRGGAIIVQFKAPAETTELVDIKTPLEVDLRIGTRGSVPFSTEDWAGRAKAIPGKSVKPGPVRLEIPTAEWAGKEVTIGVRVIGANGKASNWSNFASFPVVPPVPTPANLRIQSTANGLRLTWEGPPGKYRILRKAADEKDFNRVADAEQPDWTDTTSEFGKHYTYLVQRVVDLGDQKTAESDLSQEVDLTPKDEFAPATPAGLRASVAANSIELSWERDTEPDLAGYRIYRGVDGGAMERLAEVSQVPSYSDRAVERGKTYQYAVSAFDQAGNESPRSPAVQSALQ